MATKKTTSNFTTDHMFLPTTKESNNSNNIYEFEESDIWNSEFPSSHTKKKIISSSSHYHYSKKTKNINNKMVGSSSTCATSSSRTCSSLPVNVPDWSKIYREKSKKESNNGDKDTYNDYSEEVSEEEDREEGFRVPPHEYLARQRGASFSVHEGRGRTLKGRDLRQVRNAIWEKMGFED